MLLKVCLNGSWAPGAHPALPLTPEELAEAARAAVDAGAGAIHMHPRDASGEQSLDADAVGAAVAAVRAACPGVPVGVTTIFTIVPDTQRRAAAVAAWRERPDFASVNFGEEGTPELCAALQAIGVGIEAGLDDVAAAERYVRSSVFGRCLRVLIEPDGPEVEAALGTAADIIAALDGAGDATPRLLHGSGPSAWAVLEMAIARGYDTRIGLEDALSLPSGELAADNAELVAAARAIADRRL